MLISEIHNREDVLTAVVKELNRIGIKIRNEKHKQPNNKRRNKQIFNVPLHLLELDGGLMSNGSVAQIPKFVLIACKRIQKDLETEGLFRKTGSVKKQKAIQEELEHGSELYLDMSHQVLDVANLLKRFFRELPSPLIPPGPIQEALLRCMFIFSTHKEKCEALLMTILLCDPISVNTLAYFLQFLEGVIKNSHLNLMTTDNLVKVLTPSIMPMPASSPQKRLSSHFRVVELLIENATLIGVLPVRLLKNTSILPTVALMTDERKKQKRRSGSSLNRVFLGFRKIVGAKGSSPDSFNKSGESFDEDKTEITPASRLSKKRPLDKHYVSTISAKKKRDPLVILSSLPEIDSISSPYMKNETLKNSESAGHLTEKEVASSAKRRWSVAGGKLTRSRYKASSSHSSEGLNDRELDKKPEDGYMKISKSEYEAFKCRLNLIEDKISHEFNLTKLDSVKAEMGHEGIILNGPDKVQYKFNQTLQEVEKLGEIEGKAEKLALRLRRDLNIRSSSDHGVIRSPSARKIGSLRRRRDSTVRLSRNQSWHLGQSSPRKLMNTFGDKSKLVATSNFYPKSNLKRAKHVQSSNSGVTLRLLPVIPTTFQVDKIVPEKPIRIKRENIDTSLKTKTTANQHAWIPASDFFCGNAVENKKLQVKEILFKTPIRPSIRLNSSSDRTDSKNELSLLKTPLLPPRNKLTSSNLLITPSEFITPRTMNFSGMNKSLILTPLGESSNGRESIINLRNQNAGMVAQKAKLFNGIIEKSVKISRVNKNQENVKSISFNDTPCKKRQSVSLALSPPQKSRSPKSGISKCQFKATSQSRFLKTIRENSGVQKVELLKAGVFSENDLPVRKLLSQSDSSRRSYRTPNQSSARNRQPTPTKSPRFVRHSRDSR